MAPGEEESAKDPDPLVGGIKSETTSNLHTLLSWRPITSLNLCGGCRADDLEHSCGLWVRARAAP